MVPAFAHYEVVSNILRASRQRRIAVEAAHEAIKSLFYLGLSVVDPPYRAILVDAYLTASEQNCGLYDAIFLVISRSTGAPLITADRPLFNAAGGEYEVIWIEDLDL